MDKKYYPYIILIPGFIIFFVFTGIPLLFTLSNSVSFHGSFKFVNNLIKLINDIDFLKSIWNTLIILLFYLILKIPMAFLTAYWISHLSKLKRIVLTIIFIPTTIGGFAYGVIFRFLFSNNGIVSSLLLFIGLDVEFLSVPVLSQFVIAFALFVSSFGTMTLFLLLAIQNNISKDLVDLSQVDGLKMYGKFRHIYIPLLKPLISLFVIFASIEVVSLIEIPLQLTQGGPNSSTITIGYYIYNQAMRYGNFSYATFISLITSIFLVILILKLKSFKQRGYVYEEY